MSLVPETLAEESVFLGCDDRNRMSRLYEEVRIRLEEMAMITSRTLGINAGPTWAVKFCPLAPADSRCQFEAVELVQTAAGCGCYDYRQGTCFESSTTASDETTV